MGDRYAFKHKRKKPKLTESEIEERRRKKYLKQEKEV